MAARRVLWPKEEVEASLSSVADQRRRRELDGAARNDRVSQWLSQMDAKWRESGLDSAAGLLKTKLEDESLSTCEPDSTSIMEPPSSPASTSDSENFARTPSTSSTSQQRPISGKRKRGHRKLDLASILGEMQAAEERRRAQHDEHFQLLLSSAREAREQEVALQEQEVALRREEMAQNAAFHQAVLNLMEKLLEAMSSWRE
ncbi:uncharacterized protein LOC118469880 [Amphiprion ocellaris]|uniref:uncharacterized protein LOC118469880 n=1 Tax=Amphiprion ocellaris TaxID=80972 RepID=UPI001649801C|nr:uncharacterized protein LOC118469880 [Amphiprion ocellaris]